MHRHPSTFVDIDIRRHPSVADATRRADDRCMRCGGVGHYQTVCPSADNYRDGRIRADATTEPLQPVRLPPTAQPPSQTPAVIQPPRPAFAKSAPYIRRALATILLEQDANNVGDAALSHRNPSNRVNQAQRSLFAASTAPPPISTITATTTTAPLTQLRSLVSAIGRTGCATSGCAPTSTSASLPPLAAAKTRKTLKSIGTLNEKLTTDPGTKPAPPAKSQLCCPSKLTPQLAPPLPAIAPLCLPLQQPERRILEEKKAPHSSKGVVLEDLCDWLLTQCADAGLGPASATPATSPKTAPPPTAPPTSAASKKPAPTTLPAVIVAVPSAAATVPSSSTTSVPQAPLTGPLSAVRQEQRLDTRALQTPLLPIRLGDSPAISTGPETSTTITTPIITAATASKSNKGRALVSVTDRLMEAAKKQGKAAKTPRVRTPKTRTLPKSPAASPKPRSQLALQKAHKRLRREELEKLLAAGTLSAEQQAELAELCKPPPVAPIAAPSARPAPEAAAAPATTPVVSPLTPAPITGTLAHRKHAGQGATEQRPPTAAKSAAPSSSIATTVTSAPTTGTGGSAETHTMTVTTSVTAMPAAPAASLLPDALDALLRPILAQQREQERRHTTQTTLFPNRDPRPRAIPGLGFPLPMMPAGVSHTPLLPPLPSTGLSPVLTGSTASIIQIGDRSYLLRDVTAQGQTPPIVMSSAAASLALNATLPADVFSSPQLQAALHAAGYMTPEMAKAVADAAALVDAMQAAGTASAPPAASPPTGTTAPTVTPTASTVPPVPSASAMSTVSAGTDASTSSAQEPAEANEAEAALHEADEAEASDAEETPRASEELTPTVSVSSTLLWRPNHLARTRHLTRRVQGAPPRA